MPVCKREKMRDRMVIVSATCDCQKGRYVAECRERAITNGEGAQTATYFRLEDARRLDLVPAHPTSFTAYWLHAHLSEARHDFIRHGGTDDSRIRYLEQAAREHEIPAHGMEVTA